jgi:hypothetical protein
MKKLITVIFLFNALILFVHIFKVPFVAIDNTTILLMVLVLITPFASQIQKIKWGDFEAELPKEIKKLTENVKVIEKRDKEPDVVPKMDDIEKALNELVKKDKILAFAKLRIEIELRLKKLFVYSEDNRIYGIRGMTNTLAATGVIDNQLRNLINDITSILNRVIHGEAIPAEVDIDSVIEAGIAILNELDFVFYDNFVEPGLTKIISKKELKKYMDAKYEVTTVVPLEEKPYVNKRTLNQQQLNSFLEGYDEYTEFLVKIGKVV